MSNFFILLLLLSSNSQLGESQNIPTPHFIFRLIEFSNSFDSDGRTIMLNSICDAILGYGSSLPYTLGRLEDSLQIDNSNTHLSNYAQIGSDSSSIQQKIDDLQNLYTYDIYSLSDAVINIRESFRTCRYIDNFDQKKVEHHYDTVLRALGDLQTFLAPSDHGEGANEKRKGLAELYELSTTVNQLHRCGTGRSPQQVLLELYVALMKTEYVAMEALILLALLKNMNDTGKEKYLMLRKEIDMVVSGSERPWITLTKQFVFRYNAYVESFTQAFDAAGREHRSCDPDGGIGWERGISFFELEKYQQVTAFHRTGSERKRDQRSSCNDWINTILDKENYDNSTCGEPDSEACWMDPMERCNGILHQCFNTTVARCINTQGNPRRYSWIYSKWAPQYSRFRDIMCSGGGRHLDEDLGDTCVCNCVEGHNKISLDLSLSDIKMNRVVTAMRLARKNRIVFIQIKQGTLHPDGRIANESISWEPSSPSQASDKLFVLNAPGQGINLDDLQGADDEVLTGLGFARADETPDTRVKLLIRVTKFNYTEGQLSGQSRSISASDQDRTRQMLETNNPLNSKMENVATTSKRYTSKTFIVFEPSNLTNDAGQTTLPLFDAVPVEGQPASPLGGAELFHKKATNYGGFLSLKAVSINYAKYFKEYLRPISTSALATEGKFLNDTIQYLLQWK